MEEKRYKIDLDYREWPMRTEQLAYRDQVGVNPQYALARILESFKAAESEAANANGDPDFVPASLLDIDPRYLTGFVWIAQRRDEPTLKFADLLEAIPYDDLVVAVVEAIAEEAAAQEEKEPDPLGDASESSEKPSSHPSKISSSSAASSPAGRSSTSRTSHSTAITKSSTG